MIKTPKSFTANAKLGPRVYATYRRVGTHQEGGTCPPTCSHLKTGGCYALNGNVAMHARKAKRERTDAKQLRDWLLTEVKSNTLVRHHVSGDIMGTGGKVDKTYVKTIYDAHKARPDIHGWGYTHAWRQVSPLDLNHETLTFNASCDNLQDLEDALDQGWATTIVVEADFERSDIELPSGRTVRAIVCLNQNNHAVTCALCKKCLVADRDYVVAFRAHGSGKNKIEKC